MSTTPTRGDWIRVGSIAVLWGSVFALLKVGLEDTTPAYLTMVRLWISALALIAWAATNGVALPRLAPRPDPRWLWLGALGFSSAALPFMAITTGQRAIPSALTGILVTSVPLMTAILTQIFVRADPLTPRKIAGLAIGFLGVVLLIGPSALADLGGPTMAGQLLVLLGALGYAATAVIAFRAPQIPAYASAAGMMLVGAVLVTPWGLWDAFHEPLMSWRALGIAAVLGLGSSGGAMILYVQVVRSAGPNFTVLANYMMPVVAVITGVLLGERLDWSAFLAFAVIFSGVWLAARRPTRGDGGAARSRGRDSA